MSAIALVTGAAQGIGYACANALIEDGFRVALADVNADKVKEAADELGANAMALVCDVADPEQIGDAFDRTEAQLGPVTALVNNAGIATAGDFMTTSAQDFRAVLDVNLVGTFVASQRAAEQRMTHHFIQTE